MKVYKAIAEVMTAFSKEGISKDRTNSQGATYKFRGIDDVLNALSGHLSKAGLVVIPRVLSRECVERTTKNGGAIFYTNVDVEFDLVSAEDGSKHTARVQGEAMDTSDKSTNKAMSAAYKYMAFQTFCIPTEGDNDADASTHQVEPRQDKQSPPKQKETPKDEEARKLYTSLVNDMRQCKKASDLRFWWQDKECEELRRKLPESWHNSLRKEWHEYGTDLVEKEKQEGDRFPGDEPIMDVSGREMHNVEA